MENKAIEISKAYLQLAATIDQQDNADKAYSQWLLTASTESQSFGKSLASSESLRKFIAKLGAGLLTFSFLIFEAKNLPEMLDQILKQEVSIAGFVTLDFVDAIFRMFFYTAIFLVIIIPISFSGKRSLLTSKVLDENTYLLENMVFKLLNRKKKSETPIDLYVRFSPGMIIVIFGFIKILLSYSSDQLQTLEIWLAMIVVFGLAILPNVIALSNEWKDREWK